MVTKATQRALSAHEVVTMQSARQALKRIRAGDRFDVILCDLMMPDVTGMALHTDLLQIDRDQADRMIFMTGGAFTPAARTFLSQVPNPRLEKPFEVTELQALVNDRVR
jgi:CheY-like chemotaxis protein